MCVCVYLYAIDMCICVWLCFNVFCSVIDAYMIGMIDLCVRMCGVANSLTRFHPYLITDVFFHQCFKTM